MKNRCIILTAILSLLGSGGLSSTALAAGAAPVTVTNTPTNPVPIIGTVVDADNPARQAVQSTVQLTQGVTDTLSGSIFLPAGKIFVLEFVSFEVFIPSTPGFTPNLDSLIMSVTGNLIQGGKGAAEYALVVPPANAPVGGSGVSFNSSQSVRLYAQPGSFIDIVARVSGFGQNTIPGGVASLSGYFVNAQ